MPGPSYRIPLPPGPFRLDLTALVLERHPRNPFDRWDPTRGSWRRRFAGGLAAVSLGEGGLEVAGPAPPEEVAALLGLGCDPSPLYRLAERDPLLRRLVPPLAGLRPQRFPTVWEALCHGVACQQVSLASGLAALGRLAARWGGTVEGLALLPPPEALEVLDLDGLGLSRQKQATLRRLAALARQGGLEGLRTLPTEAARRELQALPGVGPWTASYVLLRGLGRLEVFPLGDAGAARRLAAWLGRPRLGSEEVARLVARWGEFRGLVYFYLLGAARAGLEPTP
jgi:DNA-3-methyladenine glycosylase II